jgi:hypothetical protein
LAVPVLLLFTLVEWKNLELTTKIIAIVAIGLTLALLLTLLDIEWFAQQLAHLNITAALIGSSPTSTSVRISAKITGITPFHMGIKWNGLYSGLVLLALDLYLIVML